MHDPAARSENCVACRLLKWVHHQQDTTGRDLDLRYFRDVDRREVDFAVVDRQSPILLVECKLGDTTPDRGLHHLRARFPAAEAGQPSSTGSKDFLTPDGIRVASVTQLLRQVAWFLKLQRHHLDRRLPRW